MKPRTYIQIGAAIIIIALLAWGASRGLERLAGLPPEAGGVEPGTDVPGASVARITATLYYGSADGQSLVPVRREVPFAEGIVPQAREILGIQLQAAPPPFVSVIPEGTMLRAFFVTERGDAFVDLSPEASSQHPGGSSTELLTVYAIVNAVTANLPTIQRVQILIGGREADTLAGHVDLRRPLEPDLSLVREPEAPNPGSGLQ